MIGPPPSRALVVAATAIGSWALMAIRMIREGAVVEVLALYR
jgi:hypothetical protein